MVGPRPKQLGPKLIKVDCAIFPPGGRAKERAKTPILPRPSKERAKTPENAKLTKIDFLTLKIGFYCYFHDFLSLLIYFEH